MRRDRSGRKPEDTSPPSSVAQTTPPVFGGEQHSWLFQAVMEIQKSVGGLTQATVDLTKRVDSLADKVSTAEKSIHGAKIAAVVLSILLSAVVLPCIGFAWTYRHEIMRALSPPSASIPVSPPT